MYMGTEPKDPQFTIFKVQGEPGIKIVVSRHFYLSHPLLNLVSKNGKNPLFFHFGVISSTLYLKCNLLGSHPSQNVADAHRLLQGVLLGSTSVQM